MANKQYRLLVSADWNDADYIYETSELTQEEVDELLPIVAKMKKSKVKNDWAETWQEKYPNLTQDELEIIDQYLPGCYEDDGPIHTIESMELMEIVNVKTIYS